MHPANGDIPLHLQTQYIRNNPHNDETANNPDLNALMQILEEGIQINKLEDNHMITIYNQRRKRSPITKYIKSFRNNIYKIVTRKPARNEIYIDIWTPKANKETGHDFIHTEITKRRKDISTHLYSYLENKIVGKWKRNACLITQKMTQKP